MTNADLITLLPAVLVIGAAIVLLMADLWIPANRKDITALAAALTFAAALGVSLPRLGWNTTAFGGMVKVDGFSAFLSSLFLLCGLLGIGLAYDYLKRMGIERGEYYPLLMLSVSGMMLMTNANDLIIVFLALELLSIPLYIMAGFAIPRLESEESSLKYFILGTFAAAFLLYGVALIFGATGTTNLDAVVAAAGSGTLLNPVLFALGGGMILVGFAFKMAIVPFHGWAPDVYQGAPTPVTGFMSVGAKAAGAAALLRVFITALPSLAANLAPLLAVLSIITMLAGNLLAISQKNIKRMLAYSSIAHGGYLLMAFVTFSQPELQAEMTSAMLFFLGSYALANFAAWGVVAALERRMGEGLELDDYAGLAKKEPWLALSMLMAMLSFTGMPLTIGFWGKFYLFRSAVMGGYTALAAAGLLTSVISAYYYLRVVINMYMKPGEPQVNADFWLRLVTIGSAVVVTLLGLLPNSLFQAALQGLIR
jgi:NADH-quinone oxidoreductase subunit N